MKLFQHSSGTIFSFGFDVVSGKPSPLRVCWCDPISKEWNASPTNQAGSNDMTLTVDPEFIFQVNSRSVVAYQPGICIEITYVGFPTVWSFSVAFVGSSFIKATA